MELSLVKREQFGELECDIYSNGTDYYMTRDQAGRALGYANPRHAVAKLHERYKNRLDQFSVVVKLGTTDGKAYDTYVYSLKGVMEICRHSDQPKADAFMDFCWNVMESLMTGKSKIIAMSEYQRLIVETRAENAKVRKARELIKLAAKYTGTTYAQILDSYATVELTGQQLIPLPQLAAKTYTATEVGGMLGISSNKVGILTNRHNLKTDEYGAWFNDKAKGHSKEVPTFRYYDNIVPVLAELLSGEIA